MMMHWAKRWLRIYPRRPRTIRQRASARPRLVVEALENRIVPTLQPLSLADPGLYAAGAAGGVSASGRSISDDGRYVVYGGGDNVIAGVHNDQGNVFVRDLQSGTATLVSVNTAGVSGNAGSGPAAITPNGRFVVFASNATDLVSGDTSAHSEIFVRDLVAGTTTLVSVNTAGNGGNGDSMSPVITPDGRYVAFVSLARDLIAGDTSLGGQIYVRDLAAGTTTRVSVGQGSGTFISSNPLISDNGQIVVFQSKQLFVGAVTDLFARNLTAGTTARVSVNTSGTGGGNFDSTNAVLTPNGRYVAFDSSANNLVPNDNNGAEDVFVRDLVANKTILVSANSSGASANGASGVSGWGNNDSPAISNDGRYVAFTSWATNFTGGQSHSLAVFVRDLTANTTTEISVSTSGGQPNNYSEHVFMDSDGNYVGFESFATNLVNLSPGPQAENIFVRNRSAGTTTLVTVNSAGITSGADSSYDPTMTSDGSHVAFDSYAEDLVAVDGDRLADVFVRDIAGQTTTLASTHDPSLPSLTGNGDSQLQAITSQLPQSSSDGRYVTFTSNASNLVPGDNNGQSDIFVADRQTGNVTLVSANQAGSGSGNGGSQRPVMSTDGRYVAFDSFASDLTSTPDDTNGGANVYERDLQTGLTTLVSINKNGTGTGVGPSSSPVITPDGRYVVFGSDAPDLTSNLDPHSTWNVFIRDMAAGTTTLVSVNTSGAAGNGWSGNFHSTPDGRYIVFQSTATDLVPNDTSAVMNVFVRDLVTGTTTLVSVNSSGTGPASAAADNAQITPDGRYVVFESAASNLVPSANTGTTQLFVRDLVNGTTTLASMNIAGTGPGNAAAQDPSISADGRYLAFDSSASNLVNGDSNGTTDVFIRDLVAGTTTLASVNSAGTGSANGASQYATLSSDGTHVAFQSVATNLVAAGNINATYTNAYFRDLTTGTTTLLDPHASAYGHVMDEEYTLSGDGQHVALSAVGDDLSAGDYNYYPDVYAWTSPALAYAISAPQTATAGTSFTFTVTARDQFGSPATGYSGTLHVTGSDGQAVLPADYTFTAADAGVHTFTAMLKTAGTQSLTATDTVNASMTATQSGIAVNPAAASTFAISGYPSPTTAGVRQSFTVTAQDAYGNVATGYTGTVHFTSSDNQAGLPADYSFTAADAGAHSLSATLKTAGTQSLTATDMAVLSITGNETGIIVNAAAASTLVVSNIPSPTTAGVSNAFTITALDAFGNVASGYTGTVHLGSSDSQADLPADYTYTTTDAGVHEFDATLKIAGSQSLTGTDTSTASITGSETGIVVNPAAASTFVVSGYPSPATAGVIHSFTVTAQDAYGNVATAYGGTVHLASSDGQAGLPGDYTYTAADAGMRTFSATLKTAGIQSITASDTATASITGSETGILVNPAAASTLVTSGFPSPTTAGASHNFTVTAQDAYGNVATAYTGTVHAASSDGQAALPADYTFTAADAGVHTFAATLKTAGSQSIAVTDQTTASITGAQSGITVNPATASTLAVSNYPSPTTAGVSHNFTVAARDAYGNVATAYAGTVHFTSSDSQAALPVNYSFVAADAGVHTFNATLKTAGAQSLTATDTVTASITGKESGISVSAAAASALVVAGYPSTTAGASHNFTVTAVDAYGNVAVSYTGSIHFTSSDGQAALPANYTFVAADAGVHAFSATLKTAGSQALTATDTVTSSITGTENGINVTAASATHFALSAPAAVKSNTAFQLTVTALDAYGNVATGFRGTIHFTSSDHKPTLPANYTFSAGDGGAHVFTVTINGTGAQTITATDTAARSITGTTSVNVTRK